jgi:hypothetical protein
VEFPLYIGSKKENMPNKIHEVTMHAQDFQEAIPNEKEIPRENRLPNGEIITWKISLNDTSRNEISIGTLKMKEIKLPKERMVPNKPCPLQSFMMAQSTKKKRLAFHQNTLDKDHKKSVLKKIG